MSQSYGFDTLQIHAGARPDPATGARQVPIYQTTAYVFRNADHAAALFNLQEVGYIYSRLTNPTVAALAERVATLEGGAGAVCCSSGHAAQIMALFPLMAPGCNVVASTRLYGGTVTQLTQTIRRFGWSAKFVDFDDLAALDAAIDGNTRAVFCESIANPGGYITDLPAVAAVADRHGCRLSSTTPRPRRALPPDRARRDDRRPLDDEIPDRQRHRHGRRDRRFGQVQLVGVRQVSLALGARACLSWPEVPRDLRRARLHLSRHRDRAARPWHDDEPAGGALHAPRDRDALAADAAPCRERREGRALARGRPAGGLCNLCGAAVLALEPSRGEDLPAGAGALFTFAVKGGYEACVKLVDSLNLFSHVANLGDTRSLIIHSASTTHRQLTPEQQKAAGAAPNVVRVSIGIEDPADIIADLDQALAKATA